jgi:hypothetical protein
MRAGQTQKRLHRNLSIFCEMQNEKGEFDVIITAAAAAAAVTSDT